MTPPRFTDTPRGKTLRAWRRRAAMRRRVAAENLAYYVALRVSRRLVDPSPLGPEPIVVDERLVELVARYQRWEQISHAAELAFWAYPPNKSTPTGGTR